MISRFISAAVRAMLVVLLIATPSILLPGTTADTAQIVALLGIAAAFFTFIEYNSSYPSLVEFRQAPPFNRLRFLGLFATVFALTLIAKGAHEPTTLTRLFEAMGTRLAEVMDFPYSPVRLMVLMLPPEATADLAANVRTAAGLSYLVSLLSLGVFVLILRVSRWPARHGSFNVWINLPTFDPTAGGDVVERLERDATINLILGFLLPFIIPAVVKLASDLFNPISLQDPQTLIWTMATWAFLPASLIMRGIAMNRVARMINLQRRKASAEAGEAAEEPLPA